MQTMVFPYFLLLSVLAITALAEKNEPQFRKAVNCAMLQDGNYVWGCSRFYSICTNGREYPMECYAGLKLNPDNNQCDSMAVIAACQNGAISSKLFRSKDPFVCSQDGFFEVAACSSAYIQCSQGRRFDLTCPIGLMFNANKGVCDFPAKCKKAQKQGKGGGRAVSQRRMARISYVAQQPVFEDSFSDPISPSVPQTPLNQYYGYQFQPQQQFTTAASTATTTTTTAAPTIQQADPPAVVNCAGRPDGIYLEREGDCTGTFWKCANGQAFMYNCSAGLLYNVQNGQCDYQSNVVACGGSAPDPAASTTPAPSPPPTVNAPFFDCTGRADGLYAPQNCASSFFYSCVGGTSTAMQCSAQLVFDTVNNACEFRDTCGIARTTTPAVQQDPVKPNMEHGTYYFGGHNPHSSSAYAQQAGQQQQQGQTAQAGGMAQQSQQQQQQQNSVANTAVSAPGQQPAASSSSSLHPSSLDCTGRRNGYYVKQPCAQRFFSCSNGISIPLVCPGSLVFNAQTAQCDFPDACDQSAPSRFSGVSSPQQQNSSATQGAPPAAQKASIQIGTANGFDCTGMPDGNYFQTACEQEFTSCSGGQMTRQSCPFGLGYDPNTAQCEFQSTCGKSDNVAIQNGGNSAVSGSSSSGLSPPQQPSAQQQQQQMAPSAPAAAPSPSSSSSSSLSLSPVFNCLGKQDGTYLRRPCQSTYVVCSGGVAVEQSCPSGLLFDANSAQCEFPSECGQQGSQQQSGNCSGNSPTAAQQSQQQQSSQQFQISQPPPASASSAAPATLTSSQQVAQQNGRPAFLPPSAQGFSCSGRIDGYYYRTACTSHFFTCVGGHATQLTCPGGLVFDPLQALCQYPDICGQQQSSNATSSSVPSAPQPPAPTVNFNCAGMRNGYYVKKQCSPQFYTCLGGLATRLTCPGNLVFDTQSASCQYPEICATAQGGTGVGQQQGNTDQGGGVSPSPSAGPLGANSAPPSGPVAPPAVSSQSAQQSATSFDCFGKADGFYALGVCMSDFVICSNGIAHFQTCPAGLVFSAQTNNSDCDFASACQSGSVSVQQSTGNQQQQRQQSQPMQPAQVGTVPNSPIFMAPNTGTSQQQQQQQVQTPNSMQSGQAMTNSTSTTGQQQQQQTAEGRQLPPRKVNQPSPVVQPSSNSATFCTVGNKSDGMYADKCSNHFFVCSSGITTLLNCPLGLFFDEWAQQCDMREAVPACGGQPRNQTSSTTQPSQRQTQLNQQQQQRPQPQQSSNAGAVNAPPASVAPSEFDCSGKAIGYYSKNCASRYYSCTGVTTFMFECPAGLKYNQESGQCDYDSNVPECGGQRGTTPSPVAPSAPSPPQPDNAGSNQGGQQSQQQKTSSSQQNVQSSSSQQSVVTNQCLQLPDGVYAPGCSAYYFFCQNGAQIDYNCPNGYVYDLSKKSCLPNQQVPSCTP